MSKKMKFIVSILLCLSVITGCANSSFYADELDNSVSGDNIVNLDVSGDNIVNLDASENDTEISEMRENEEEIVIEDTQYHYDRYDEDSVNKWVSLYASNVESILNQPQEWWDNLYDYELDLANALKSSYSTIDVGDNFYQEQSVQECIRKLENDVSEEEFFYGTMYEGLTLEDMYGLENYGYNLSNDFYYFLNAYKAFIQDETGENQDWIGVSSLFDKFVEQSYSEDGEVEEGLYFLYELCYKLIGDSRTYKITFDSNKGTITPVLVDTGYGGSNHSHIWVITFNGKRGPERGLCADCGKHCNKSIEYQEEGLHNGPWVFFLDNVNGSIESYVGCQIAFWIAQKGEYSRGMKEYEFYALVETYLNKSTNKTTPQKLTIKKKAWTLIQQYYDSYSSGSYYIMDTNQSGCQRIMVKNQIDISDPDKLSTNASVNGLKKIDKSLYKDITISDEVTYSLHKIAGSTKIVSKVIHKQTGTVVSQKVSTMSLGKKGSFTITFDPINIESYPDGTVFYVTEEITPSDGIPVKHTSPKDKKQQVVIGEELNPEPDDEFGDLQESYTDSTTLKTKVVVDKSDIETSKKLQGVDFEFTGDFGPSTLKTDSNGQCYLEHSDTLESTQSWYVTTSNVTEDDGHNADGTIKRTTKYYYTCPEHGQSGSFGDSGSRDSAGRAHCLEHAKSLAIAEVDRMIAEYKFTWSVKEVSPRTSTHTSNLATGGNDSYTTGYHNNPVITRSNTETGYHRDENRTVPVPLTNERVRGTITINKSDMDYLNCRPEGDNNQDFIPQGDASLAGAVYGLYANADIIRPDGKSGDRTGLPTNIRMDYCTGSVDDPSAHKTYTGKNPFGIDAIHTTTPLDVPIQQVNYNYTDGTVYHKGDLVAVGMFDINLIKGTFQ